MKPELNPDGFSVKNCSVIYAPRGQAGEYSRLATNPYRGCGHKCLYCVAPDTLIQMADGSAKQISRVEVGDSVTGIERDDPHKRAWSWRYKVSRVLNKISTIKPAYRLTLENGMSVVCSADHRWLTERGWKFTERLTLNNSIRLLALPVETPAQTDEYKLGYLAGLIRGDGTLKMYDYSGKHAHRQATDVQYQFRLALIDAEGIYRAERFLLNFGVSTTRFTFKNGHRAPMLAIRANSRSAFARINGLIQTTFSVEWSRGWLAGIFDAEGSLSNVLRISNKNTEILSLTEHALRAHGLTSTRDVVSANGVTAIRLQGGRDAIVRFFNVTNPAISRKFAIEQGALRGASRVIAVEPLNKTIEMVDITTSTENFVANGMVAHNCYVPSVIQMNRAEFDAGAHDRKVYRSQLLKDARKYQLLGITEQVLLSFTTDPYHPFNTQLTRETIQVLTSHGMAFCTLTKGGSRALRDMDLFRPARAAFAGSLTLLDERASARWEAGAASPAERIATLKRFHEAGIYTWVSLEPVIDPEVTLEIIRLTHPFVDLYKVGRINYSPLTKRTDWRAFTERVIEIFHATGSGHYIKEDLQPYLPAGYENALRRPQHR